MRQEFLDLVYHAAGTDGARSNADEHLYLIIEGVLGEQPAGNPVQGRRQRLARDLGNAQWQRIYDLIERLWPEFERFGTQDEYRAGVNRLLAAHGIAWDFHDDGHLRRVLPIEAQGQLDAALAELGDPKYAAALPLYQAAQEAFNARPRPDRNAIANIFDALESVAKVQFNMPNATFYDILAHSRRNRTISADVISILESLNTLRNHQFGHGTDFTLTPTEVDFAYLSCSGGILHFVRMP
ncbi:MAG: hypothetical protein WCE44_08875 [Candidatus Velthaea sp.]